MTDQSDNEFDPDVTLHALMGAAINDEKFIKRLEKYVSVEDFKRVLYAAASGFRPLEPQTLPPPPLAGVVLRTDRVWAPNHAASLASRLRTVYGPQFILFVLPYEASLESVAVEDMANAGWTRREDA